MAVVSSAKIIRTFACINPLRYFVNRSKAGTTVLFCEGPCSSVILNRSFKSSVLLLSEGKFTRDPSRIVKKDGTVVRKKIPPNVVIDLVNDSEITVVSLKAAEAIARAKGLNLVKAENDVGSLREKYRLVKDSDLGVKDYEKSVGDNDFKTYIFSETILDNDLKVKMKSLLKHLQKKKKLRCLIKKLVNQSKAEAVFEKIKEELKKSEIPLKIVSTSSTNTAIQFKIEPNLDEFKKNKTENEDKKS